MALVGSNDHHKGSKNPNAGDEFKPEHEHEQSTNGYDDGLPWDEPDESDEHVWDEHGQHVQPGKHDDDESESGNVPQSVGAAGRTQQ